MSTPHGHLIDDVDLNAAMLAASKPVYERARAEYGKPLPPVGSEEFLAAPESVRQAALMIVGISRVHNTEPSLMSRDDYSGGKYHRQHALDEYSEIQRHRYPPTGDRDLWVKYGPAGPPTVPEPRQTLDDDKECLQQRTDAAVERAREACQAAEAATDWGVDDAADDHAVRVRV